MKKLFLCLAVFSLLATGCEKNDSNTKPFDGKTVAVATPGTLSQLLVGYDKTTITELTLVGSLSCSDISMLNNLPNLAVLDMENVNLEVLPDDDAFQFKTSLTSVKLPKTLKTIGCCAFYGCSNLTSITIPDGVTKIGGWAFVSCNSLTNIEIPASVTEIKILTFWHCYNLTSITIGASVTEIGERAFDSCSSLASITIPDSVKSIGDRAFYGCSGLTSITIPDSVTKIGSNAFDDCSGLRSVTIGNSVTSLWGISFSQCSSLTSIYCKVQTPPIVESYAFNNINASATLYVPTGSKAAYAAADGWKDFKTIVEVEF